MGKIIIIIYVFISINTVNPAIIVNIPDSGKIVLIDKSTGTIALYKNLNDTIIKLFELYASNGLKNGDKKISGDKKTPEGIYFPVKYKSRPEINKRYGAGALVLNYPNPVDEKSEKTGSGIWIHGTNKPERLSEINSTNGCITINNIDFIKLNKNIRLNQTPIIITEKSDNITLTPVKSDKILIDVPGPKIKYMVTSGLKKSSVIYSIKGRN